MNILFVEDDAMNRRVVKDMLSVVGARMAEAENAETGLRMVGEDDYDVVLMDLRMPGMDGLTAIQHLRARGDSKAEIPIIVVTADMAENLREDCLSVGANEVMMKPVAMNQLLQTLSAMIATAGRRTAPSATAA